MAWQMMQPKNDRMSNMFFRLCMIFPRGSNSGHHIFIGCHIIKIKMPESVENEEEKSVSYDRCYK